MYATTSSRAVSPRGSRKFARSTSLGSVGGGGGRAFGRSQSATISSGRGKAVNLRKTSSGGLGDSHNSGSFLSRSGSFKRSDSTDNRGFTRVTSMKRSPRKTRPHLNLELPSPKIRQTLSRSSPGGHNTTTTMSREAKMVISSFKRLTNDEKMKVMSQMQALCNPSVVSVTKPRDTNLGITCALRSLKLMSVGKNSPAEAAGLAAFTGRVITRINSVVVKNVGDIRELSYPAGRVTVSFEQSSTEKPTAATTTTTHEVSSDEEWLGTEGSSENLNATMPQSPRINGVGRHLLSNFEVSHSDLTVQWGRKIGQGAFSDVYAGVYAGATDVAVKILKKTQHKKTQEESDFLEEVGVMTKLHHPNILLLIGASFEEKNLMLVTELCDVSNLRDIIRTYEHTPVEWSVKLDWCTQICRGMAYLHLKGIHHRDLKPSNVFISQGGMLKIADFGLSSVVKGVATLKAPKKRDPETGVRVSSGGDESLARIPGTFSFIAPEIWAEEEYLPESDVYSFGVCVVEMVTTYLPFEADTSSEVSWQVMTGRLRPTLPSSLRIPSSFRDLVNRTLCYTPTSRPAFTSLAVLFRKESCAEYAEQLCPSLEKFCATELMRPSPPDPKCAGWT